MTLGEWRGFGSCVVNESIGVGLVVLYIVLAVGIFAALLALCCRCWPYCAKRFALEDDFQGVANSAVRQVVLGRLEGGVLGSNRQPSSYSRKG